MTEQDQGLPFSVRTHKPSQKTSVCVCVGHLEHQSTHAEDHAQQVHVVRRGVLQGGIGLRAGRLVPATQQTQNVTQWETQCLHFSPAIKAATFQIIKTWLL